MSKLFQLAEVWVCPKYGQDSQPFDLYDFTDYEDFEKKVTEHFDVKSTDDLQISMTIHMHVPDATFLDVMYWYQWFQDNDYEEFTEDVAKECVKFFYDHDDDLYCYMTGNLMYSGKNWTDIGMTIAEELGIEQEDMKFVDLVSLAKEKTKELKSVITDDGIFLFALKS